jgi:pilus assembly protein CpaC
LQNVLKRTFPDSQIVCQKLNVDTILLRGFVTDNETITSVMDVASTYAPKIINQMRVGGPQEVQLKVRLLEVQRSKIRDFGINWKSLTENSIIASTPGSITPLGSNLINPLGGSPSLTLSPSSSAPPSLTAGFSGNHFAFEMYVQALKQEGLLKIYSEPVLFTRSGEPARLSDGGEFPIPVPGGLGTVTIMFKEFGVILETLPIVISPTKVKLQIYTEVSEKDLSSSVTLAGTTVPGITRRQVKSTVHTNFGDTIVIGGLISSRDVATTYKIPGLGELPWLGAAFRKVNYQRTESEMIVLVTPEFAGGIPSNQLPPGGPGLSTVEPNDRELYGTGLIEVPNYGPLCDPNCRNNCPTNTYNGSQSTEIQSSPAFNPAPMNHPVPSGLIAPPGTRTTVPPPPSPGASTEYEPPGSASLNRTKKPKTLASAKPKKPADTKNAETKNNEISPATYKKSSDPDSKESKSRFDWSRDN